MSEGFPQDSKAKGAAERQREMEEEMESRQAGAETPETPTPEAPKAEVPEDTAARDEARAADAGGERIEPTFSEPDAPTLEALKTAASEGSAERNLMASLSLENQKFLNKMSEGGRNLLIQASESIGLDGMSTFKTIAGKMGVAYNQFWLDRHAKKAAGFKREMDMYDLQTGALDKARGKMMSIVEKFTKQGVPGAEAIALKLNDIDRQKAGLLNKKDRVQSKFEGRDNKVKLYANERDRIADKLIGRYNEKLEPMEAELGKLETCRDEMDLSIAVTEAKHNDELLELSRSEKENKELEEALRTSGASEREIRKFIEPLADQIAQGRAAIRAEKDRLAKQKAAIDKKVAKADARANPYRDKREEFVRVKAGRPVKMEAGARTRGKEFTGREEVAAHPRGEAPTLEEAPAAGGAAQETAAGTAETTEEATRFETSSLLSGWNTYLKETYGKNVPANELVDSKDFLKTTKLPGTAKLNPKDFKNILGKYYKLRKMPLNKFSKSIDKFSRGEKPK